MFRPALILSLLFLSLNCSAACDVAVGGKDTISLVVGKGSCFQSAEQRALFANELKAAVQTMQNPSARELERKSTAEKLNGFGDLRRQAQYLSPKPKVYYGQR